MKAYQHSLAFESLKATEETITENLTSLHYLQTLDLFLWRALEPIHAECPSLFHNYVAKIVARQLLKASTKFTSLTAEERPTLPINLFNAVTSIDPKKSHEHIRHMYINRGLMFGFLSWFLNHVKEYERLHLPSNLDPVVRRSLIYKFEHSLGIRHDTSLYTIIQQVRYWDDKARWFKGIIMEKYHRLALNHAQRTYKDYNHYIPLDDVVQIHLLVLSRAIDRCNPRLGVLTTFVNNWFKSARSEVDSLAKGQTDQSFESLSEDYGDAASDIFGYTEFDTSQETVEHISYLAKRIDKHGYVRAWLGIPEFMTLKQKEKLWRFAAK
jgi:hypothetical protein